ncbi:alpha/beta family hydrolase [Reyranella sp.]|uniref:alpha/beta family hydrolase n=1 Tax=Reyranella sp. TaxID=1929291 RepID=UPI00121E7270|nr:alpha/beta family hydrolase [Reyranella sp.]TAJ91001.1 MAG: hypothetical protein EPO50_00275 [Reyranella sp.]
MFGPIYFLSGDGYPTDAHVDRELQRRLSPSFSKWIGQKEIYHPTHESFRMDDFSRRTEHLEAYLAAQEHAGSFILMGRSSGARLATLYASRHPVSAIVCLGYPFRNPAQGPQPERYLHLAELRVPTLICQGLQDEYGGRNIFGDYALSPSLRVHLLHAEHEFNISSDAWDSVARIILEFCQDVLRRD